MQSARRWPWFYLTLRCEKFVSEGDGKIRVWRGDDPVVFGRILAALELAGLAFDPLTDFSHLSYFPDQRRPGYSIAIAPKDYGRAAEIIEKILAQPPTE